MIGDLKIDWSTQEEAIELAEFLTRYVTSDPTYISHRDIQVGRALDERQWSPNLHDVILAEFLAKTPKDGKSLAEGGLVTVRDSTQLVAVALVAFRDEGGGPYGVFEDLLMAPSQIHRTISFPQPGSAKPMGQLSIGDAILRWVQKEARARGITRLFMESGFHKERTHALTKKDEFCKCSVTMIKSYCPTPSIATSMVTQSMAPCMTGLKIAWSTRAEHAATLTDFFVRNVMADTRYISHGEIQLGRAIDEHTWNLRLPEIVLAEILEKIADFTTTGKSGVVAARDGTEMVAISIVSFREEGGAPYGVLEDLLVHPSRRGHRIGANILEWIEHEGKQRGMQRFFLESGLGNEQAHHFFERNGFRTCSVTMTNGMGI
jgi:N-acetylglutamate synthase-like GNAT family acetyltransferase